MKSESADVKLPGQIETLLTIDPTTSAGVSISIRSGASSPPNASKVWRSLRSLIANLRAGIDFQFFLLNSLNVEIGAPLKLKVYFLQMYSKIM